MFQRIGRLRPIGFVEPCLPAAAARPRTGPEWVHEIKHDGYRLMVRRDGDRVRLFTRRGHDWGARYPVIIEAAHRIRSRSFLIDGEAVYCGSDGISDFETLHTRAYDDAVFLYGFDLLELDGEDYRQHPLVKRKGKLQRLLAETHGIRFSGHIEGDGPTIFKHICKMGLEGIVSKRRDLHYVSGRAKCWVKVLNPASAARLRCQEGTF